MGSPSFMQLCLRYYETPAELRIRQWGETARFYLSGGLQLNQGPSLKRILDRCEKEVEFLQSEYSMAARSVLSDTIAAAKAARELYDEYLARHSLHCKYGTPIYPKAGTASKAAAPTRMEYSSSAYCLLDWELRRGHTAADEAADRDVWVADNELSRLEGKP